MLFFIWGFIMIIIGSDIRYRGRVIRYQTDGFFILSGGAYITATETLQDAIDLIDWLRAQ